MDQTNISGADIVLDETEQKDKEELINELLQKNIEGAGECSAGLCGTPDQSGGGCGCGCGSILIAM